MKLVPFKKNVFIPNKIEMGLFGLAYRQTGGFFETPGIRGTSHLMEHLMCKPFDDMREELTSLSIDHNAFTSDNQVVFYFSGLTEELKTVVERLYEKITKPGLEPWTKEAFESEKSTVLQEYGDMFNSQESGFYYNLMRKHYNYTGAIGIKSDIESFTYEQSLVRAAEFTLPSIICQVGEEFIKPDFAFPNTAMHGNLVEGAMVSGTSDGMMYATKNPDHIKFGEYDLLQEVVPKDSKTLVGLLGKMPADVKDIQVMSFLIGCINGGLEAPLYDEIREKRGLSYYSAGEAVYIGERCLPMFFASTTEDNIGKLKNVYRNFFELSPDEAFSETRFNAVKKAFSVKRRILDVLPHAGAKTLVLGDINPFEGIAELTYHQALDKYDDLMRFENYVEVQF
jgi:predicted Zn-dependent peptidase